MHDASTIKEIDWIQKNAKRFAKDEDIDENDAIKRLTQQSLKDLDYLLRAQLSDGDDAKAQAILSQTKQTFQNDLSEQQKLFTSTGWQFLCPEMYADTADPI